MVCVAENRVARDALREVNSYTIISYPFVLFYPPGERRRVALAGSPISVQERPSRSGFVAAGGARAERGRRRQDDQEEPGNRFLQHCAQPAPEAPVGVRASLPKSAPFRHGSAVICLGLYVATEEYIFVFPANLVLTALFSGSSKSTSCRTRAPALYSA